MRDLSVIVVSTNEGKWLRPCLGSVFEHAGRLDLDVVVADNRSTDGTRDLVRSEFPKARVVTCDNRGFAHANNRGLLTCDARYILFLNPDTEVLDGTFEELVDALDDRPEVGLAGVKQVIADGTLWPTMRRFPNVLRGFGEAFGFERWPIKPASFGERELDLDLYDVETGCDWTSGSFMLVRREAIESAGFMDERFFIYSEETDFCYRIKKAGWEIRHLPQMTILHHFVKAGINPKMEAQYTYARLQYARKNFSPVHRAAYAATLAARHGMRALAPSGTPETRSARRAAARRGLRVLVGLEGPPFGTPPAHAVLSREESPVELDDRGDDRADGLASVGSG